MKDQSLKATVILGAVAIFSISSALRAERLPHTDADNLGEWELQLAGSDEFDDGMIDASKWHVQGTGGEYFNRWKGRAPSQFIPEAISESGGNLRIHSRWNEGFAFADGESSGRPYGYADRSKEVSIPLTTGALISKSFFQNCYMEIRCKVGKSPMSGSFWAVSSERPGEKSGANSGEIDVFEHVGESWDSEGEGSDIARVMQSSIHTWDPRRSKGGNRIWTHEHLLDFDVTDGFHVYAADWSPEAIRFYVDGRLVREITKSEAEQIEFGSVNAWCVDSPMRIWIDSEIFSWKGDVAKLDASMFEDAVFEVDYVRVWKRGADVKLKSSSENLVKNGQFSENTEGWEFKGASSRRDVSRWKYWKDDNPNLDKHCLVVGPGAARAQQKIAVDPETSYILSAHLRVPGTTGTYEPVDQRPNPAVWEAGWFGVEGYGGEAREVKVFRNQFQSYSIEFTTGKNAKEALIYFTNRKSGWMLHVDSVKVREI